MRVRGLVAGSTPVTGTDYHAVFERSPDGILLVDDEGVIRDANAMAEHLFDYPAGGLVGVGVERLVPETLRGRHVEHRRAFAVDPRPRPMGVGMELRGRRRDGTEFPVEIALSPAGEAGGGRVIVTVRDQTERNRLRAFGSGAVEAAEAERLRISRELHDGTAQELATALLELRLVQKRATESEGLEGLEALRERLALAIEGVRRIARGLRPPALEDVGLGPALESLVSGLPDDGAPEVTLELSGEPPPLDPSRDLAAYRIVQEALANVARHADAGHASVRIIHRERELVLEIRDDGCGFNPDSPTIHAAGLGLIGMRERAQAAGGQLQIESLSGAGTTIRAVLPVALSRVRSDA